MINTNEQAGNTLTEEEANKLFYKAMSEIHKGQGKIENDYEVSTYSEEAPAQEQAPVAATPEAPAEPAKTPTPVVATPIAPEKQEEKKTEPATPPAAAVAEPQTPTLDGFLTGFPEDKRDMVKQLLQRADMAEQRFRSTSGRLHQERAERKTLNRELAELRNRVPSKQPQDPALAKQTALDSIKSIDEWNQVIQAEPTLAKAVSALTDAKVEAAKAELRGELEARTQPLYDHSEESDKQAEWERLVDLVPNVGDVIQSNEFKYWKSNVAPQGFVDLIENSVKHQDAIAVLQAYAPWAQAVHEERSRQHQPTPAPVASPAPAVTPASAEADEIAKHRANKSVAAVVPGGNPAINVTPSKGGFDSDEAVNAYFLQAYEKAIKR